MKEFKGEKKESSLIELFQIPQWRLEKLIWGWWGLCVYDIFLPFLKITQKVGILLLSAVLRLALSNKHWFENEKIQTQKREGIKMSQGYEEN